MDLKQGYFKLNGIVQHYSWGGYDFIPGMLGIPNKEHKPFAEYWLGAHPNFPAKIINDKNLALNEFVASNPTGVLGKEIAQAFGSLPYLFKVLDVRQMLSIQVHPDKKTAEKEYKLENEKGIALNAPNRNYKDENHKPELMVALGDFWLLHGFKSSEALLNLLQTIPELTPFKQTFANNNYKGLFEHVMKMEQNHVNTVLKPLLERVIPPYQKDELRKDQEDFWAAKAALTFCKDENIDRGIFSIYFFNLLHLKKGEGIFQPEGMPHAYLEGQNVEIMANSDNVLRAGLTDKHIDVPELLKHVKFQETIPQIIDPPEVQKHRIFSSPAKEFELHEYNLDGQEEDITARTGEVWMVLEGVVSVIHNDKAEAIQKGDSIFVLNGNRLTLKGQQKATLFRVTVPILSKN